MENPIFDPLGIIFSFINKDIDKNNELQFWSYRRGKIQSIALQLAGEEIIDTPHGKKKRYKRPPPWCPNRLRPARRRAHAAQLRRAGAARELQDGRVAMGAARRRAARQHRALARIPVAHCPQP